MYTCTCTCKLVVEEEKEGNPDPIHHTQTPQTCKDEMNGTYGCPALRTEMVGKKTYSQILVDIYLAVTCSRGTIATPSPGGYEHASTLAQYWRCDRKSANPPVIIPSQYFRPYYGKPSLTPHTFVCVYTS